MLLSNIQGAKNSRATTNFRTNWVVKGLSQFQRTKRKSREKIFENSWTMLYLIVIILIASMGVLSDRYFSQLVPRRFYYRMR